MEYGYSPSKAPPVHARLLRCRMQNPGGKSSVRYVELEQFRLWAYMMEHRHGIRVQELQLSLWVSSDEFRDNSDLFLHSGQVEDVSRLLISWFNPRHHYTLEAARYVPSKQYGAVREILLSHISDASRQSRKFRLDEQHGVCVNQEIEDPGVDLILGISDVGYELDPPATA